MANSNNHGGRREGSGRHNTGRDYAITVKISAESKAILDQQSNKSKYIDELIENSSH